MQNVKDIVITETRENIVGRWKKRLVNIKIIIVEQRVIGRDLLQFRYSNGLVQEVGSVIFFARNELKMEIGIEFPDV